MVKTGGVTNYINAFMDWSFVSTFPSLLSLSQTDTYAFISNQEISMDGPDEKDSLHVLSLLQSLKKASKNLQLNPISNPLNKDDSKPAIEALLDLGTNSDSIADIVSSDPILLNLFELLTNLKTLFEKLEKLHGFGLSSLLRRQITKYKILKIARSIEAEIQSYIDREIVVNLVTTLIKSKDDDEKVKALVVFGNRLSQGFHSALQEMVLRGRVLSVLELVLCSGLIFSQRVKNQASVTILGLVMFNKDVFVGLVLMGPTVKSLLSISTVCTIQVLYCLIGFIGTPLVDEIEANGDIPRIIGLLSSEDIEIKVAAMHSVFEMAFLGRREVIEAMLKEDLVEKMMVLQRTETEFVKLNCVARFAEEIQVGEGLERREKLEFRVEILRRVKEASVSDEEAATIVAEVLWGNSLP